MSRSSPHHLVSPGTDKETELLGCLEIQMEVLPGQEESQRPGEQLWDVQRGLSRWDLARGSPWPLLWVETLCFLWTISPSPGTAVLGLVSARGPSHTPAPSWPPTHELLRGWASWPRVPRPPYTPPQVSHAQNSVPLCLPLCRPEARRSLPCFLKSTLPLLYHHLPAGATPVPASSPAACGHLHECPGATITNDHTL